MFAWRGVDLKFGVDSARIVIHCRVWNSKLIRSPPLEESAAERTRFKTAGYRCNSELFGVRPGLVWGSMPQFHLEWLRRTARWRVEDVGQLAQFGRSRLER